EAYLSGMGRAVALATPKPTAMVLNYPSNPTAQVASIDFYKEAVAFAKKHDIWILSDLAYSEIYFSD
ncbi:MAG TPA: aminotransferase, partial [Parvularcula sp.]|nr:aminotransferase [Parvularcula sp.]